MYIHCNQFTLSKKAKTRQRFRLHNNQTEGFCSAPALARRRAKTHSVWKHTWLSALLRRLNRGQDETD